MTRPITSAGYQDVRDHIVANWNYFAIYDEQENELLRIPTTDPRCTWVHAPGAQELDLQVVLKGTDADIASLMPVKVAFSGLFKVATGGDELSYDGFAEFNIASSADILTINHKVQVPQIS